jgi:hypothetical protein
MISDDKKLNSFLLSYKNSQKVINSSSYQNSLLNLKFEIQINVKLKLAKLENIT